MDKAIYQETRDKRLKNELTAEKVKLIEKHGLIPDSRLRWISKKENSHEHIYFTHHFAVKSDLIGLIFRINKLCFAKLKYFRSNIDSFDPYVYIPEKGFVKAELWDSDFLMHKQSGLIFDYRYFQRITKIEDFEKLCVYLESFSNHKNM